MDATKFKRLEEYASSLDRKGAEEEKSQEYVEAITTYLKLVDVLLVMADATPSYQYWVKCTTKAESYQKKVKNLIALTSLKQQKAEVSRS